MNRASGFHASFLSYQSEGVVPSLLFLPSLVVSDLLASTIRSALPAPLAITRNQVTQALPSHSGIPSLAPAIFKACIANYVYVG